ncbi:MAG: AraC family transcriptional regulator [Rhodocyclaceae bacterium]|nr:AraC family transcriptional regulator [Rhodocyclaceae bacterium]
MASVSDSREKGTIAIAFVREALASVSAADAVRLVQDAGIAADLLEQPQARVSSQQYAALWHRIAQFLDDEFFGMDSRRMKHGAFTLLCHSVIHADTLERALRRTLRFLRVLLDDLEGVLLRDGDYATITLVEPRNAGGAPLRAFAYGTFLLMVHGLACWLVRRRIALDTADFRCAEPDFGSEWKVLFSPRLRFDRPQTCIRFAADFLDLPNVQNERTMKLFLRGAPANFLVKYRNSDGLTAQIRRRLREIAPAAWPDFADLACHMHTSASTLRRRLEQDGDSYQTIKDDLRRDLAIARLAHSDLSLDDIAAELGFAETSGFHRAFKKWTGSKPGSYRRARPVATVD